jgi:hypothetical protein
MLCSLVSLYRYFGRTFCLHLQGRKVNRGCKNGIDIGRWRTKALREPIGIRTTVKEHRPLKGVRDFVITLALREPRGNAGESKGIE